MVELTNDELEAVRRLAESMPAADAIGQLIVVGPPGDAMNYRGRQDLLEVIRRLRIGNFILSSYHYPSRGIEAPQNTVECIQDFHRYLRDVYRGNDLPPPILFADFESSRISSFKMQQAILAPAAALTLASTKEPKLIRTAGRYAGYQLIYLGIDAILGPVVDIDGTTQGVRNELIDNRVFGGTPQLVYGAASHYLFGLKEAGILTFLKHFPGYGFVNGSEYNRKIYPTLTGGCENFEKNLMPFRSLGLHASGIMSSHVRLAQYDADNIAAFSPLIMNNLLRNNETVSFGGCQVRGLGLSDTVLISDDFSDMGAIHKSMGDKNLSYGEVALQALHAGHDLLIFSHLETEKNKRGVFGLFRLTDLTEVVRRLTESAMRNPTTERRVRQSLFRVLKLKAQMAKQWYPLKAVDLRSWSLPRRVEGSIDRSPFLQFAGFNCGKDLILEIMRKAYSRVVPGQQTEVQITDSSIIFVSEKYADRFRDAFPGKRPKIRAMPAGQKSESEWNRLKTELCAAMESNYDRIIYIYTNPIDDRNLISHVASVTANSPRKRHRMVILVHTSPKTLPTGALYQFQILGNFTVHPLAIEADKDLLSGYLHANDSSHLTVHVGRQGEVVSPLDCLMPAAGLKPLDLYTTELERALHGHISKLNERIKDLQDENSKLRLSDKNNQEMLGYIYRSVGAIMCAFSIVYLLLLIQRLGKNVTDRESNGAIKFIGHLLCEVFRAKKIVAVTCALILLLIGGVIFFEVGFSRLYLFAKASIDIRVNDVKISPSATQ